MSSNIVTMRPLTSPLVTAYGAIANFFERHL